MGLKITGTGSALPALTVTNDMLAQIMDTSDAWIGSRTGIRSRRIAVEETTSTLAILASRRALEASGTAPEEIDLIIAATFTPQQCLPCTACRIQEALGCSHAAAFDLNAACSGFLFALNTAEAYFEAGIYKKALLVGAEVISKMTDWSDRSTCVLFGDGAGAVVAQWDESRKMKFVQGADGAQGNVLVCEERHNCSPWSEQSPESLEHPRREGRVYDFLHMDGQEVFKFAVRKVPECISGLLEQTGIAKEEVDWYLLHQANQRIIASVAKRLGIDIGKFPTNLEHYGNTSAASIPILLDEMNRGGRLQRGQNIVLSGFGAGLTFGAAFLEW